MKTQWQSIASDLAGIIRLDAPLNDRISSLSNEKIAAAKVKVADFKAYQRQREIQASTAISVSPIFKGDGNYSDFVYHYFAGAFSDQFRYTAGRDNNIVAERFGMGIEIELKISKLKTALRGGFGMVAAAAEMDLATVEYSYHIHALPNDDFYNELPSMGKFDSDVIQKFKTLVKKLKSLYSKGIDSIDLVAVEVLLASAVQEDNIENARSYYFACKKIIDNKSLKEAVNEARKSSSYNEDAIQYMYSRLEVSSLEAIPSSQSINRAKLFLNL